MSEITLDVSQYAPEFEIFISNQSSPNENVRRSTISIQVNEQISESAQYSLVLSDSVDVATQKFQWLDNKLLDIGNSIRIDMGYASRAPYVKMIEGPIKSLSTSGFSGEIPKVTLTGYDRSHAFLVAKETCEDSIKPDKKDTYSNVAENIARKAKLDTEIEETDEYAEIIIKKSTTYNELLRDAAARLGYEFFIARGKLYFINPFNEKKTPTPVKTFVWERDLIQFVPIINTSGLVREVEVRGHLPHSKKKVVGRAETGEEVVYEKGITASKLALKFGSDCEGKKTIENKTFSSQKEADDMAKAELNRSGANLVTGSATIIGDPSLIPGKWIKIEKVGKRFSGLYFITGVVNTIDGNGYTTTINVRRNVIGEAE